ncbi:uncharacterized protein LOC144475247 [Augochlora pura]
MEIQTPYLDAIQSVPGKTAGEKYKCIATLIKERTSESNSLEEVMEGMKVSRLLAPLIQAQTAQILIKRDPKNQDNYNAISEALKSEDAEVVAKALQVNSFFDGSNKKFTNIEYFLDQLFPFVSLNTRKRIIKKLSIRLKETGLAEKFFNAITAAYSLEQALPLLPACSESFIFDTIVKRRIVLSRKLVETIFHKYPDLIVRYFKLSNPREDPNHRNVHKVDISNMGDVLAAMIKKRPSSFVGLYEMHEKAPVPVTLSRKRAEYFMKNAKDHLLRKPKLFIDLVPLQIISATHMEVMFPKLFPEKTADFDTNTMLNYLTHYPEEKKADLLIKSYREIYGDNILDNSSLVTFELMLLLPADERIRQAKIKIEEGMKISTDDFRNTWRCYLPTKDTIPEIKNEIQMNVDVAVRAALVCQMIFNCKVNNEEQTLLEVLTYVRDRHKNEQSMFLAIVLSNLMQIYDVPRLNKNIWSVLLDIIVRVHIKDELKTIGTEIVEAAIHFRILNKQPIDKEIKILVQLNSKSTLRCNFLQEYPEYERMCLEACLVEVSKHYKSDEIPWCENRDHLLHDVVVSIYTFNWDRVKRNIRLEPIFVKDYPWLLKEVERIIKSNDSNSYSIIMSFKYFFRKFEKSLFDSFWEEEEEIEMIKALALLKKDPSSILSKWKEYLAAFHKKCHQKDAMRFMRASRWYNDIPVKFLQQSLEDLKSKKNATCLKAIALLVQGETLTKILEPLVPPAQGLDIYHEQAKEDYTFSHTSISCARYSNPPISMNLVIRYCVGDYLREALVTMMNLCRRIPQNRVLAFVQSPLNPKYVSVHKNEIRIMRLVAPKDKLYAYLTFEWKNNDNHSIREVLFSIAKAQFAKEPGPDSWTLISEMIPMLGQWNNVAILDVIRMIPSVSDEYVSDYIQLIISVIVKISENESTYWCPLIQEISPYICNLLPEKLTESILRKFLFVQSKIPVVVVENFALNSYLMYAGDKFDARMKTFADIFNQAVKNGWDVPNPKWSHVRETNHFIGSFVKQAVFEIKGSNELKVLEGIMNAFHATLSPEVDPTSYLLLFFKKEQVTAKTPKDFGLSLGRKLKELIDIYTQLFLGFIADLLNSVLKMNNFKDYENDDATLSVIEGLMEVGSPEATFIAAHVLVPVAEKKYAQRYNNLIAKLLKYDHPAVKSIICDNINKTNHNDFSFDRF